MIAARRAALAATLLSLSACRYGDVRLDDGDIDSLPARALTGGARCTLPAFELRDARPSPVLASVGGQQMVYDGLARWTESALRTAAAADATRHLEIELARAYLEPHRSGHGVQFVLRVREDAASAWRVYRGGDSGITWWGTDGEFATYVENAAGAAIRALLQGEATCES